MKRIMIALAATVACVALTGCRKTCTCVRYDGTEHAYTSDEVDDYDASCSTMRDAVNLELGTMYYSYCEWTE